MLTDNWSILFDDTSTPSSNTIVLVILACKICAVAKVPAATWVDRVPSWEGFTCNSYSYALRAPNTVWCSCIKSWSASLVTSWIVLLMSWRSPLVKVIGSIPNFKALTFFLGTDISTICWHFNYVDVAPRSMLPSIVYVSSTSCPEDVAWPRCMCCCYLYFLQYYYFFCKLLLLRGFLCQFSRCPYLSCYFLFSPFLCQLGDARLGIVLFLLCYHLL